MDDGKMNMNRRMLLKQMVSLATFPILLAACASVQGQSASTSGAATSPSAADAVATHSGEGGPGITPLTKPLSEWQSLLPAESYNVLFEEGTEAPFSSPLLDEHREGTFICLACNLPLFDSKTKFESGTGWPSFYESLPNSVGIKSDFALIAERTEYHCLRCGGHQGHVFDDGPQPTGKRYCNNGVAIQFVPKDQTLPTLRSLRQESQRVLTIG